MTFGSYKLALAALALLATACNAALQPQTTENQRAAPGQATGTTTSATSSTAPGTSTGTATIAGTDTSTGTATTTGSGTGSGTGTDTATADTTDPVVTDTTLTISNLTPTGFTVSWTGATDDVSLPAGLSYDIYVDAAKVASVAGLTTYAVTGLTGGTTYDVVVTVEDAAGNVTTYATKQVTTSPPPFSPVVRLCKNGQGKTADGGDATTPWDGWVNYSGPIGNVTVQANLVDLTAVLVTTNLETGLDLRVNGEIRTITALQSATLFTVGTAFSATHTNMPPYVRWALSDANTDDYQGSQGGVHYTGAQRSNCNATQLTDVSATVVPDASKNAGWTNVWQDQYTGLYFTNRISSSSTWSNAHDLCAALDGGTGGSGWRLPTHKEQLQLYVDGAGELPTTFGFVTQDSWSSTTVSTDTTKARAQYFSTGPSGGAAKTGNKTVFCVRPATTGTWPTRLCKNGRGVTNAGGDATTPWAGDASPPASADFSVDDWQNNATLYTGAGRSNCNETNFSDVSATVVPDAAKHASWSKSWRDLLTGLYFTNIFPAATWQSALAACKGLDGGTGGSGWRLPSQKELAQLYIDGVARTGFTPTGNITTPVWSSTTISLSTSQPYRVTLSDGNIAPGGAGKVASSQFICVRE